jgi:GNAT superfamily N-acetyltransferase
MTVTVEAMSARARPDDQLDDLFSDGWPEFITADREVKRHIGRVRELFEDLELVLLDSDDVIVAAGWAVPVQWSGEPHDLPDGYTASLAQALTDHDRGGGCNTLVVMAAQVHPHRRGQGLAGKLLAAFAELADARELTFVVAPVRPTFKSRYPLTPIERFATWTRDDRLPLDPWIRTHVRIGARVVKCAPSSQTMTGTVVEWERWTQMALPDSGSYVIPDGLNPLDVDVEADLGTYIEPNVWVRHR